MDLWGLLGVVTMAVVILAFFLSRAYLRHRGIRLTLPPKDLEELLNTRFRRAVAKFYELCLLATIVLSALALGLALAFGIGQLILWANNFWWFIPIAVLTAWGLYLLRDRVRSAYGLTEVIAGIAAISTSVLSRAGTEAAHLIAVLGGIYIVVRGLDNIEQGMDALSQIIHPGLYTRIRFIWARRIKRRPMEAADVLLGYLDKRSSSSPVRSEKN
jgi:hypothetical protein